MSPAYRSVSLRPPLGGIVRRFAIQNQAPYTSPSAQNIWGSDYSVLGVGRDRISTRAGLTATSGTIGTPYSWADANWTSSGAQRGIIVACDNGLWKTTDGSAWVELITDSASSDFVSCTSFKGIAYFARFNQTCLFRSLASASGAGTALTAGFFDPPTNLDPMGVAPTKCGLVGHHQNRLVLLGDHDASQAVYFSATDDPTNWDFSVADDPSAAVAFTVDESPTSFISHTRDCCLIGTINGIHALRGNPNVYNGGGGELDKVSHYVGPLSQSAWTHDANGNLWYLGCDGLYKMLAGCGDFSQSISRETLPHDLVSINPGATGTYASVSYDPFFRCLWIYVDQNGAGNDVFWSYDLQAPKGAWWQHTFSSALRLGATLKGASTTTKSAVLAFNANGVVYQYDEDSSESMSAFCFYGPIQLGSAANEGILHAVQATVGEGSDDVSWTVHIGQTAEAALAATASFTGSEWAEGLSDWQHVRNRGAYAYIKVFTTGTDRFSFENIDVRMAELGMRRSE